ncbi:MAG: DinB family protein [Acidobacteria bacterium]|nr:MAG: DinB family protein [Acidobacteriota bacterium]
MPATVAEILQEFDAECATTRRVLERVPADQLTWKPHAKSMSLGQLALHVAMGPGIITGWALQDSLEMPDMGSAPQPASGAQILSAHEEGIEKVKVAVSKIGDTGLGQMWQLKRNGATIMTLPKGVLIRSLALNHVYHHRGQLSVYLRLLDVPVPSIYGPSADENPMAAARA